MFRLDARDSSDNLIGPGPVYHVSDVSVEARLDEVGGVEFTVPAADARILETLEATGARYVDVVQKHTSGVRLLGRGLLRDGNRQYFDTGRGPQFRYNLPSVMQELAWGCTLPRHKYDSVLLANALSPSWSSGDLHGLLSTTHGVPSGWTVYTPDAINPAVTVEFDGETVLAAVRRITEDYEKHYRESESTLRRLEVSTFGTASGIRLHKPSVASQDFKNSPYVMPILNLEIVDERQDVINWICPLGKDDLTLEHWTYAGILSMTGPDGSTIYYIKDATSIAAYAERRHVLYRRDIEPASSDPADLEAASMVLYQAAAAYLAQYSEQNTTYRVDVFDSAGIDPADIAPGNTVRVVYRGVATYRGTVTKFVDLDDDVMIVSRRHSWSESGRSQYTLELATNEYRASGTTAILTGLWWSTFQSISR